MKKILFVCLGNICRSPTAEGVFKKMLTDNHLEKEIQCDSAGIIGHHQGSRADSRMIQHAKKRGYNLTSISRPVVNDDFDQFDMIIGMDHQNIDDLRAKDSQGKYKEKIFLMTSFCKKQTETVVPDPYYGGDDGFELVLNILEDACKGLLKEIN